MASDSHAHQGSGEPPARHQLGPPTGGGCLQAGMPVGSGRRSDWHADAKAQMGALQRFSHRSLRGSLSASCSSLRMASTREMWPGCSRRQTRQPQ